MLSNKIVYIITFILCVNTSWAYNQARELTLKDSLSGDQKYSEMLDSTGNQMIYHWENLSHFWQKLHQVDSLKQGKVNIVHIGDSHIQADFFTGRMRELLQDRFGNAGLGFAFPYKLARTNGNTSVKYSSNVTWDSYRNIFPVNGANVGLSGIALSTNQKTPVIELSVDSDQYRFTRVKVFTPETQQVFNLGTSAKKIALSSGTPMKITHKIKSGESLSLIARKYHVSISDIKKLNNLRGDNIVAGKNLFIPSKQTQPVEIDLSEFSSEQAVFKDGFFDFNLDREVSQIYFYPNQNLDLYDLNGIVLENQNPGIVYHSIGVNGARYSDYTKYPLFFEQLKGLEPDLIIISMGTNESFDKMDSEEFKNQVNEFLQVLKSTNPQVDVLITSPPPSYFGRNKPNTLVTGLSNQLIVNSIENSYAIWDLYYNLGGTLGLKSLQEKGYLAKDLVHYTVKGYQYSADLFYQALMHTYTQLFQNKHNSLDESI
ncbi:LysM peptidoglycan-binding domain-containing protein [Myroides sp. LJL119]